MSVICDFSRKPEVYIALNPKSDCLTSNSAMWGTVMYATNGFVLKSQADI